MDKNKMFVQIGEELVSLSDLIRGYEFWQRHRIKGGETACPLCGCDFSENELAVCDGCNQLVNEEDLCHSHEHGYETVCKECCDACQREKAYEDAVNLEIDRRRGK